MDFPPELVGSIICHLALAGDTASVLTCALVCHAWLPQARYFLLLSDQFSLELNQFSILKFLDLFGNPSSTLYFLHVESLRLHHNGPLDVAEYLQGRHTDWRDEKVINDFLVQKSKPFSTISSLTLEWIDWRTLSLQSIQSLHTSYPALMHLNLSWIAFSSLSELQHLVYALSSLEKINIGEGVPFDMGDNAGTSAPPSSSPHPALQAITLTRAHTRIIRFFVGSVQYVNGPTVLDITLQGYGDTGALIACRELVMIAGGNLKVLKLCSEFAGCAFPTESSRDAFFNLMPLLNNNLNLQDLCLDIGDETLITPVVESLATEHTIVHRCEFGLHSVRHGIAQLPMDWKKLDEKLSALAISSGLQQVVLRLPMADLHLHELRRFQADMRRRADLKLRVERFMRRTGLLRSEDTRIREQESLVNLMGDMKDRDDEVDRLIVLEIRKLLPRTTAAGVGINRS